MASKPVPPRPLPRLYLATPVVDDPALLMASLPGLLAAADVAAASRPWRPRSRKVAQHSCSMVMSNWSPVPVPMARI